MIQALPTLLGLAVLLPLASFFTILLGGRRLGPRRTGWLATGAIVGAGVLSLASLAIWLAVHPPGEKAAEASSAAHAAAGGAGQHGGPAEAGGGAHAETPPPSLAGDYYRLAQFGPLRLTIGYYIDSLTVCMFCMVTLIASCIHFYSMGYMHEELDARVEDPEVRLADGRPLRRRGRYHVFFQYLSLFSFSMLGLVLAGNLAMVFVFWELVGICSYFLIGFYIERRSACLAANKAFIVNRVGDFGMIIGLMALWCSLGTLSFGDADLNGDGTIADTAAGVERGLFSQVRPADADPPHALRVPEGMVRLAARSELAAMARQARLEGTPPGETVRRLDEQVRRWAAPPSDEQGVPYGYWLLVAAGLGVFCGCVGKSAQFPLHVWLPDAMEGPTPVSALVHSATMVAAGVYLVGRFFPVFAPEVLLAIAVIGCITLLLAATIAVTATDIKRVLAYSTVSQLGYMMLALGVGGWLAGMLHLFAHAFFKSLLFLCSGSVIHAVHTNDMTQMGGLRKKMPITAYTMLVGCLAIVGAGIPFIVGVLTGGGLAGLGLSGFYSKDAILEQAYAFMRANGGLGAVLFFSAAGGAAITAFYMFRLWYLTFAGAPRDQRRYEHAHESPRVMWIPLLVLSFFAVTTAWRLSDVNLISLLEQSRPAGTLGGVRGLLVDAAWPSEHASHTPQIVVPVTLLAIGASLAGFVLATLMYGLDYLDPEDVRRQFPRVDRLLRNKWWFDELYEAALVRPCHAAAAWAAAIDRRVIDAIVDGAARLAARLADFWDRWADRAVVDGLVNWAAGTTYAAGLRLRAAQTGRLRQYVLFLVVGAVALFVLISFFWSPTFAR